jgi:glycosyltransferase involved in cell wall biosynthesis
MKQEHFTVLIPTRERCRTLQATIQTCLSQDYDNLTVIVSDNASTDATRDIVHSFDDPRLRYVNPGRRLSMSANFNFAVDQAGDGIVCSIGDDDGLMPGAISRANELINAHPTLPLACRSVFYVWPDYPDQALRDKIIVRDSADRHVVLDSREELARRIQFRSRIPYVWGLPGVYRGFLSKDLISRVLRSGRYIHSITPDAYSVFSTLLHTDRYAFTTRPLFIEGVSGSSNGASQSAAVGGSGEEQRYLSENELAVHADTVYSPAHSFVMIEAYLQVRDQFPEASKGFEPDLLRMCRAALAEAGGPKGPLILRAVEDVRRIHGLPPVKARSDLLSKIASRGQAVIRAWRETEIDGKSCGVRDVYAASIAAQAAWNDRRGQGAKSRASLIMQRMANKLG